jgi:hypothetical protein
VTPGTPLPGPAPAAELPFTGSDAEPLLLMSWLLMGGGGVVVVATRRRRRAATTRN